MRLQPDSPLPATILLTGWTLIATLSSTPESTFYVRVKGDSMKEAGIFDGDLCLVDKAPEAE